jgi:prophage antirepressor-like protein
MDLIDLKMVYNNNEIRILGTTDDPWFVAKDICEILEIKDISMALIKLSEKYKGTKVIGTPGGKQDMRIINESGLYKLIMRSNKPIAEKFQEWVCEEVLPSIRRKGEYKIEEIKQKLEEQSKEIKQIENEKILLQNKILRCRPRVPYKDKNVIYVITSRYHLPERIYLIGKAVNFIDRLSSHNRTVEHEVIFMKECNSASQMRLVELMVLTILSKYREITCRDRFVLPEGKDISLFTKPIEDVINLLHDVDAEVDIENYSTEDIYNEDNRDKITEQRKFYRENNPEKLTEQNKQYYEKNKEELLTKNSLYREDNSEKISKQQQVYREENKEELSQKIKCWKETHKDELVIKNKEYHQKNRTQILEKQRLHIECECGAIVSNSCLSRHKRTPSHQNKLANKEEKVEEEKEEVVDEEEEKKDVVDEEVVENDRKKKIKCNCGLSVVKHAMNRHLKSKIHESFLKRK